MITKTRSSETVTTEVKEEARLDWEQIAKATIQLGFVIATMFVAHSLYIFVWRMMTGH
jgi:ABC-type uncharacterized transport system permease subunit